MAPDIKKRAAFKKYDSFHLKRNLDDKLVPLGTHGVVLEVFEGSEKHYEVEFPYGTGSNLGDDLTYTISEDYQG